MTEIKVSVYYYLAERAVLVYNYLAERAVSVLLRWARDRDNYCGCWRHEHTIWSMTWGALYCTALDSTVSILRLEEYDKYQRQLERIPPGKAEITLSSKGCYFNKLSIFILSRDFISYLKSMNKKIWTCQLYGRKSVHRIATQSMS